MYRDLEDRRAYQRRWYEKNRVRIREIKNAYREKNKEKFREWQRNFEMKNKEQRNSRKRKDSCKDFSHIAEKNYERQQGYKRTVLNALGGHCFCCGETEIDFLTLEHLNGDGNIHRASGRHIYLDVIRQGMPKDKYGVLCMNCNFARRFGNVCPHQRTLFKVIGL